MVRNLHGGDWQFRRISSVGKPNLLVLLIPAILATAHARLILALESLSAPCAPRRKPVLGDSPWCRCARTLVGVLLLGSVGKVIEECNFSGYAPYAQCEGGAGCTRFGGRSGSRWLRLEMQWASASLQVAASFVGTWLLGVARRQSDAPTGHGPLKRTNGIISQAPSICLVAQTTICSGSGLQPT